MDISNDFEVVAIYSASLSIADSYKNKIKCFLGFFGEGGGLKKEEEAILLLEMDSTVDLFWENVP